MARRLVGVEQRCGREASRHEMRSVLDAQPGSPLAHQLGLQKHHAEVARSVDPPGCVHLTRLTDVERARFEGELAPAVAPIRMTAMEQADGVVRVHHSPQTGRLSAVQRHSALEDVPRYSLDRLRHHSTVADTAPSRRSDCYLAKYRGSNSGFNTVLAISTGCSLLNRAPSFELLSTHPSLRSVLAVRAESRRLLVARSLAR